MIVVSDPSYAPETRAFLERVGTQNGPLTYDELLAMRSSGPDPALAGTPEPIHSRAEVLLPLSDRSLRIRVYRPELVEPRPLLLWLHGGGFVAGTLDDVDVTCTRIASQAGVVVVSLDYRLAPEHPYPAALDDTVEALAWLAEHGGLFGGNGRVAAGGQSAGATLVAAASLKTRDDGGPAPVRQVLCYPTLDFDLRESHSEHDTGLLGHSRMQWYHEQYLAGQPVTPYAAPLTSPDVSGLPPALMVSAGHDPLRDDARRYTQRLRESGVHVRHVEYDATPHAFLNFPGAFTAAAHAANEIAEDLITFFRLRADALGGRANRWPGDPRAAARRPGSGHR